MAYPGFSFSWNKRSGSESGTSLDRSATNSSRPQRQSPWTTSGARGNQTGPYQRITEDKTAEEKSFEDLRSSHNLISSQFSQLQRRNRNLLKIYHETARENQDMQKNTFKIMRELELMHEQSLSLEQELQACKDDLFKLQPRNTILDSSIAQAFDELHDHIASWMDGEVSCAEKNLQRSHHDPLPEFFSHDGIPEFKRFFKMYPTSGGEYIVRCAMEHLLHMGTFTEDVLLHGLSEANCTLLRRVEQSMAEAKPPEDPKVVNAWRSDTLSALSATTELQENRQEATREIAVSILQELVKYFVALKESEGTLQTIIEKVIEPAVELANKIKASRATYEFVPKMDGKLQSEKAILNQHHLSDSKLIDITTNKTLKANSPVQANERGQIGTRILTLAPALYRSDPGKQPVLLVKAIFLVQLFKPLGKRRVAAAAPQEQQRQGVAVLIE